ncbi:MAG: hypothetical protein Q7S21_07190 [archaeon]|nr:hypothetical protein [archaeon]
MSREFHALFDDSGLVYGDKKHSTVIICLWSRKEEIAKRVSSSHYAALGQLFNAERGIDFLIRTLLANPQISNLVVTGADLGNAGKALKDFFEKGFEKSKTIAGKETWKVKSDFNAFIGIDIPEKVLQELRDSIKFEQIGDISKLNSMKLEKPKKTRQKHIFPPQKQEFVRMYTSEEAGFLVRGKNISSVWIKLLDQINKFGKQVSHDGKNFKEIIDAVCVIESEDPDNLQFPEFLSTNRKEFDSFFKEFLNDENYGKRISSQIASATEKLSFSIGSRKIVISLWNAKDLNSHSSPVITELLFKIQNNKLFLTATIASNEAFKHFLLNAFSLRKLQQQFLDELNKKLEKQALCIDLGAMILNIQSAHIFEADFSKSEETVKQNFSKILHLRENYFDPRGNFVIYISEGKIVIEHLSPDNQLLFMFDALTAYELWDILVRENIITNISHALYIGTELQKAEIALKNGLKYEQDKALDFGKKN